MLVVFHFLFHLLFLLSFDAWFYFAQNKIVSVFWLLLLLLLLLQFNWLCFFNNKFPLLFSYDCDALHFFLSLSQFSNCSTMYMRTASAPTQMAVVAAAASSITLSTRIIGLKEPHAYIVFSRQCALDCLYLIVWPPSS